MKTVRFCGTQINFQNACVHCLKWARETYPFERTFFRGRGSILLRIPAPLCTLHLRQAKIKSPAQIWCDRIGLAGGGIIGLASCAGLLYLWLVNGEEISILNILLAVMVGISLFVTTWAITYFWLTPLFASAETRAVTNSLRLTKYDPFRQVLELAFANDTVAELTARENLPILDLNTDNLRQYRISAHILDHDIRYNGNITTQVLLDHIPTEKEAGDLLQPVIDKLMVQQMGEGTFYDLDLIEIENVTSTSPFSGQD